MPQGKTSRIKNEAQYEALVEKGMSKKKAARIANTPDAWEKGGKAEKYEDRTKKDLYNKAKEVGIEGRSTMRKEELIKAPGNTSMR